MASNVKLYDAVQSDVTCFPAGTPDLPDRVPFTATLRDGFPIGGYVTYGPYVDSPASAVVIFPNMWDRATHGSISNVGFGEKAFFEERRFISRCTTGFGDHRCTRAIYNVLRQVERWRTQGFTSHG